MMGEGHSSNRTSDNLQECPSKALAPHRDSSLPYVSQIKPFCGLCRGERAELRQHAAEGAPARASHCWGTPSVGKTGGTAGGSTQRPIQHVGAVPHRNRLDGGAAYGTNIR